MHLTRMEISGGGPPFASPVEFGFDERVNVFVGPNASGKSSLLRMLGMPVHDGGRHGGNDAFQYICQFAITASEDWPVDRSDEYECAHRWAEMPWVQIPATRISLPWSESGNFSKPWYLSGTDATLDGIFRHGYVWDVFDGNLAEEALQLLSSEATQKDDTGKRVKDIIRLQGKSVSEFELKLAVGISHHCAKQIASEIVTGAVPTNLVGSEVDLVHDLLIRQPDVRLGMAVDIVDGDSIAANYLSSGTQSSLLWIRFLALQMLYHYEYAEDWYKRPAILLIDEIENHLHPTWQRRVIPALLDHFPGLQIFATTHSPFVVAGREIGQVHQLIRDTNGLITAKTNTEPIKGLTSDEICRQYLEVQDPTDLATAEAAAELRQLRDEGPRDSAEAEEERQARMQELRRLVDRDLLAGGPMASRRELFEQRFNEALEKYRQSRGLGQDSG